MNAFTSFIIQFKKNNMVKKDKCNSKESKKIYIILPRNSLTHSLAKTPAKFQAKVSKTPRDENISHVYLNKWWKIKQNIKKLAITSIALNPDSQVQFQITSKFKDQNPTLFRTLPLLLHQRLSLLLLQGHFAQSKLRFNLGLNENQREFERKSQDSRL